MLHPTDKKHLRSDKRPLVDGGLIRPVGRQDGWRREGIGRLELDSSTPSEAAATIGCKVAAVDVQDALMAHLKGNDKPIPAATASLVRHPCGGSLAANYSLYHRLRSATKSPFVVVRDCEGGQWRPPNGAPFLCRSSAVGARLDVSLHKPLLRRWQTRGPSFLHPVYHSLLPLATMHVNDLPSDVLALVFRAALPAIKRQPADAKSGLGLLSVCRRWREVALPMVYNTVVIECATKDTEGPENVYIMTNLDLVVDAKCLHAVRRVVIDVWYCTSPFQGLKVVIGRMRGAADKWAGVRRLELSLNAWNPGESELLPPADNYEDEIASVSSALAALMPGLREITFGDFKQTPIVRVLCGQLAGFYADQLQVLHSSNSLVVPQDRVFTRLRDVKIAGLIYRSLEGNLLRLDPEVVESLVLRGLAANDMWSMFCADSDGCAITFPRLTNLDLRYRPRFTMNPEQFPDERPWALQFPAAKRVQIVGTDEECPSMENAVFPDHLESLDITYCSCMLPVISGRKIHAYRSMALSVMYEHDASNSGIVTANRMLAESNCHNMSKLVINGMDAIPPELITYTGLTHLDLNGPTNADDVMVLIHRMPRLMSLSVISLNLADAQTDFSIPQRAEHEPVVPLNTQIKTLAISPFDPRESNLTLSMLKYLMLRTPTLKSVTAAFAPVEEIQAFIDEYVLWYPHLANIELVR